MYIPQVFNRKKQGNMYNQVKFILNIYFNASPPTYLQLYSHEKRVHPALSYSLILSTLPSNNLREFLLAYYIYVLRAIPSKRAITSHIEQVNIGAS